MSAVITPNEKGRVFFLRDLCCKHAAPAFAPMEMCSYSQIWCDGPLIVGLAFALNSNTCLCLMEAQRDDVTRNEWQVKGRFLRTVEWRSKWCCCTTLFIQGASMMTLWRPQGFWGHTKEGGLRRKMLSPENHLNWRSDSTPSSLRWPRFSPYL